jgi:hypothetical protein
MAANEEDHEDDSYQTDVGSEIGFSKQNSNISSDSDRTGMKTGNSGVSQQDMINLTAGDYNQFSQYMSA